MFQLKQIALCFAVLILSGTAMAQQFHRSYYITTTGDTVRANFKLPVTLFNKQLKPEELMWYIHFVDAQGKEKLLIPEMTKAVFLTFDKDTIRLVPKKNSLNLRESFFSKPDMIFVELVLKGKINAYRYYIKSSNAMMGSNGMAMTTGPTVSEAIALEKKGEELWVPRYLYRKKDLTSYFSSCPELVYRLEAIKFKGTLDVFALQFNSLCD